MILGLWIIVAVAKALGFETPIERLVEPIKTSIVCRAINPRRNRRFSMQAIFSMMEERRLNVRSIVSKETSAQPKVHAFKMKKRVEKSVCVFASQEQRGISRKIS
jgi:hypothetical protein